MDFAGHRRVYIRICLITSFVTMNFMFLLQYINVINYCYNIWVYLLFVTIAAMIDLIEIVCVDKESFGLERYNFYSGVYDCVMLSILSIWGLYIFIKLQEDSTCKKFYKDEYYALYILYNFIFWTLFLNLIIVIVICINSFLQYLKNHYFINSNYTSINNDNNISF